MEILISLVIFTLLFSTVKSRVYDPNDRIFEEVRVGLVVDLGSIEGKVLKTSFALALSDFYRKNNGYRTRLSVLAKDSQGDPLLAFAAATNLVKKTKVEVTVGAQSLSEAKLLAAISKKAKVVVISALMPNSLSLNNYDHFLQLTHDTASEAQGIASLVHNFSWKSVVVIYEDVDEWREGLQILMESFQDKEINIARFASFALSSGENHMENELREAKDSGSTVFVVHMSEILVSRLFRYVEKLEMMEEGFAWILTTRTMHRFLNSDGFAMRSMQGVVGFRSYIPVTKEVENFTSRMRKLMSDDDDKETKSFNSMVVSVRAHDMACILATVVEKISRLRGSDVFNLMKHDGSASSNVSDLLKTIRVFKGLSGDIQINENKFLSKTFEIVNIVGMKERRVGLWSCGSFRKRRHITWPRGGLIRHKIPRNRFLAENGGKKLLRVLVSASNRVPNLVSVRPDPETGSNTATGFCVEVFKICIAPFKYELEFIPYNGSFDNLAYLLSTQRHKYDAAVGDITITSNRSSYVDLTLPFTDIGIGALTLIKKKKQGMWTFFDPLERSLWLASGAFFVLTGIVVWLVERPVNPEFQGSWRKQLGIMLWFGFSTIVFTHREKLQRLSSRFLVIVWIFVVLILTSSYSANLTSTTTISRIQLDSQAVFGPPIIKTMKPKSVNAVEAYAQSLRDGSLKYVVDEIPYLNNLLGQYPDVFAMIAREATTNGFGFMFQKGSGLAPKVSREIAKLRSLGVLKDMEKRWFQKLDSLNVHSKTDVDDDTSNRFTFHELGGLFIIAGVAHALVLAMHIFQMRQEIYCMFCGESGLLAKLQSFASFGR